MFQWRRESPCSLTEELFNNSRALAAGTDEGTPDGERDGMQTYASRPGSRQASPTSRPPNPKFP